MSLVTPLNRVLGLGTAKGAAEHWWMQRVTAVALLPLGLWFAGSVWFKLPLVGWTFCFFFHLTNGVRHLFWDAGLGFEKARIRASGWAVVVVTLVATAAFAMFAIV